jgi:hypothetical protein
MVSVPSGKWLACEGSKTNCSQYFWEQQIHQDVFAHVDGDSRPRNSWLRHETAFALLLAGLFDSQIGMTRHQWDYFLHPHSSPRTGWLS